MTFATVSDPKVYGLRFDRTLPRAFAHRRAVSEVFVVDSCRTGENTFAVASQIPPAHSLWSDRAGSTHDPLAMVEASRQAVFVALHRHLGVPTGPPSVLHAITFRVCNLNAFRNGHDGPLEGIFLLELQRRHQRGGSMTELEFSADLMISGAPGMSMSGVISTMSPDDYASVRAMGRSLKPLSGERVAPEPLAAEFRSHELEMNVVIGAGSRRSGEDEGAESSEAQPPAESTAGVVFFPVIVNQAHPSFYDHPQDHVPGPLLFEAFRQSAIARCALARLLDPRAVVVTFADVSFSDFAEPEGDLECSVEGRQSTSPDRWPFEVKLHQFGKVIGGGRLELCRDG